MEALDLIVPFPWFLNKAMELSVNDQTVSARITATEWIDHWRPFLANLVEVARQHPQRLMVGLAGASGSGKSVLAEQLAWLSAHGFIPGCRCVALPMDGFYYPNSFLAENSIEQANNVRVPMAEVKGAPETYDVAALREHLELVRKVPESMFWPAYSHKTHEPIPEFYRVHESDNLVIVEGNYLLVDNGPFAGIGDFFDLRVYIEAPAITIIANLMERHLSSGKTVEEAKRWVKQVDLANARMVEVSRSHADVLIERDRQDDFRAVKWRDRVPKSA